MEFRILGPVQAVSDGGPLALGGTKQRALLALLVLHANETLSRERLIDELWGERPPATAQKAVQVYMSRLRKALGGAAGVIVTREVGYQLVIDPESIDAHRFELRLEEAKRAPPDRAETMLEEALALWRGAPLEDLAHEPFAQRYAERLEDLRLAGLELLIEAQLARGRHDEVVQRLERLIAEHPYRERFRAQLMLALYRSDRQADALKAYHDARRTLVEDLGIEPGERLRELERAILAQDIADDHVSEPAGAAPVTALPRALRVPRGAPFVGRERELARLRELWDATGCVAVALEGEAGIGKTRLAAELARLVPGPVLYGRCDEGLSAPYQPLADALRPVVGALGAERLRAGLGPLAADLSALFPQLDGLGAPPRADPGSEQHALFEAVAALFELAAPRALLVVDDLHWAPEPTLRLLRHLIRSERRLKLLVLLSYRDTDAAGLLAGDVEPMPLRGLDEAAIASLLEAAGREARLAGRLRTDTNGNPLFVRELLATGALDAPPETLRQVIAQRVGRLSDPAQRVLTVAAVAGQEFSVAVVERVVGEDLDLLDALDEATAARLLTEAGHGDYAFAHALVRQTIYDGLSAARRARLHLRVGETLEALGDTGALVHHFSEAGEAAKAADLALAAGREAAKRHAYEEAAVHYRRGLAARPDRERQRALQLALERTRYQPLPDLGALPAWAWRRLPRPAKVAVALIGVAALALGLALGPGIERSKREDAAELAQQLARSRAEYVERVRAEQRPRFGTAAGSRTDLMRAAATAVGADARALRRGPILRVACEPYPAGSTPDPSARVGRYSCLAVTAEIPATDRSPAGATGHDYRVRIEFDSGRYAYCKVASVATKSLREPVVPLPRACSGR